MTSPTKYNVTILQRNKKKNQFFLRGGLGSDSINLRVALSMALKFYASVAKELKLKVRKFWGLIPAFVD